MYTRLLAGLLSPASVPAKFNRVSEEGAPQTQLLQALPTKLDRRDMGSQA